MSKQPEDSIEHFHNVIDIDLFFSDNTNFKIDKEMVKKIKGA
jgi:hypothetical protein